MPLLRKRCALLDLINMWSQFCFPITSLRHALMIFGLVEMTMGLPL